MKITIELNSIEELFTLVGIEAKVETKPIDFVVRLISRKGANLIDIIRAVRTATGLGLKDAKDLVDGAPNDILKGPYVLVYPLYAELERLGATVTLKPLSHITPMGCDS